MEPSVRSGHTSVVLSDGSVLVLGGTGVGTSTFYNDVWKSPNGGSSWIEVSDGAEWKGKLFTCVNDSL